MEFDTPRNEFSPVGPHICRKNLFFECGEHKHGRFESFFCHFFERSRGPTWTL